MNIKGKIIEILPLQSGEGKNGTWEKQEYVLETEGEYPKKIHFAIWGEKIGQYNVQKDEKITAFIEIESRDFNGKWYTNIRAWKIDREKDVVVHDSENFSQNEPNDLPF